MNRCWSLPLVASALLAWPASGAVGQKTDAPPSAASRAAAVRFIGKPACRRVRQASAVELTGDVTVSAAVLVTESREPLAGKTVTLFVHSGAGVFESSKAVTDRAGRATPRLLFGLPPGSLELRAQVCLDGLPGQPPPCTETVTLSLRNWADLEVGFDMGYLVMPKPAAGKGAGVPVYSDNVFNTVLRPRLTFTLWETERNWKYYGFSIYGTIPGLFQDRSLLLRGGESATFHSLDRTMGWGDFAAGANLSLRGNFSADVSYNGANGKVSLVDSMRNLGTPRAVNLGDGFESLDTTVQLRHVFGARGPLVMGMGSASRARPRRYAGGRAERGDFYQLVAGVGSIRKSRDSAVLLWGGFGSFDSTIMVRDGQRSPVSPARQDWLVGVSRVGLGRGPVSLTAGVFVGGLGREPLHLGLNLGLAFRLF